MRLGRIQSTAQPRQRFDARRRDRDAMLGHLGFETRQPGIVENVVGEQAVAFAQRPVVGVDARAMRRIEAHDETVEKWRRSLAPSRKSRSMARRQPDGANMRRQRRRARDFAIDPDHAAARGRLHARFNAGADAQGPLRGFERRGDGPAARAAVARDLDIGNAAKPAARREQRNRLEHIRLAGAVFARQHGGPSIQRKFGARVRTEVRDHKTAQADARMGRRPFDSDQLTRRMHSRSSNVRPRRASASKHRSPCRPRCRAQASASRNRQRRTSPPRRRSGR